MKAILQRVTDAKVEVDSKTVGEIGTGFLILLGVENSDTEKEADALAAKIAGLRIFTDENDKMNLSLLDVKGELLIISQFTLYGDARKGRRPNFMNALGGDDAKIFYDKFIEMMKETGLKIETGIFGAHMQVDIKNDGPVTILLDSSKAF